MASTGFVIANTGNQVQRSGTRTWSNTVQVTANDGVVSSCASSTGSGQKTWTLYGVNLGLSLPTGAVIRGIEARIECWSEDAFSFNDDFTDVVLRKADGTFTTTDRSTGTVLTTTETAYTYGSATDLWGETWDKADVEDADFGAGFAFLSNNTTAVVHVDYIALNVHYDVEATSSPSAGLSRMLGNTPMLDLVLSPTAGLVRMLGDAPDAIEAVRFPETGVSRIQGDTPVVELAWTPEVGLARMIGQTPTLTESEGGFWHKAGPATGAWSRAPTAL